MKSFEGHLNKVFDIYIQHLKRKQFRSNFLIIEKLCHNNIEKRFLCIA